MSVLKPFRRFAVQTIFLLATLLLGGCFVSQAPLIGPENAVYPFQSITLYDTSGDEGDTTTLALRDGVYVDVAAVDEGQYLLVEFDTNLFLAQMRIENDDNEVSWIYGIVQLQDEEFFILAPVCGDAPQEMLDKVGIEKDDDGDICAVSSLAQLDAMARLVVGTDIERSTFRIVELVR